MDGGTSIIAIKEVIIDLSFISINEAMLSEYRIEST